MMIRLLKQASLGVLLLMAALLTACSSEDKAQPDTASREQPKTWKLCIQANKTDSTTTRGLYLDGSVLKSKWGDPSTSTGQTVEVWRGDSHLGNLTASASSNGSTVITGELTGTFTKDETLTLYSPSKTRDYSGQTGTIESMSAKDYVSAEITVTAVDGSSGVLATSDAAFERLQSFNKFTVTPAMHTLHVVAEGMSPVTTTLSGTTDGTEFYVALPSTGGSAKSFTFMGRTNDNVVYTCSKTKQLVDGNYYSGSITLQDPGLLPGLFSVAANKKVYFSQGNLQYQASTNTWRFAENQYDFVGVGTVGNGGNVIGSNNSQISSTYDGWIDLFGWGTSGYQFASGYGTAYQPWSTSAATNEHYGPTDGTSGLTGTYANGDWGSNAISNGGNSAGLWRTLTKDEWTYVFNTRSTTSGVRYAKAKVNGVNGVILLPDDWSTSYYSLASTNTVGAAYNTNSISSSDWSSKFEAHGAVFLPAAGFRHVRTMNYPAAHGNYWSTTASGTSSAYSVFFYLDNVNPATNSNRYLGCSVRLVRVAP